MEAPVGEPPGESLMRALSTDMPNEPPGESSGEASAIIKKPKAKGKWLPLEIQIVIIHLLDTPSYVEEHLEDDPADYFTLEGTRCDSDDHQALQNASLVCRAWHREIRPLLFRHLHLRFPTPTEPINIDERAVFEEAVGFLEEHEDFLSTVVESVTLSLTLPAFLRQQREEIIRFSHVMGAEDCSDIVETLGYIDSFAGWGEGGLLSGLNDCLFEMRPQRITILATGAAMAVFLHNRDRYPASYCFIESPRLQILRLSRRQTEPGHDPEWGNTMMGNLLQIVDGDDLIVNDGSLLQQAFRDSGEPNELDLHELLIDGLDREHQQMRLKSLSFVSLFNFKRGLMPLSHTPIDVLRHSSPITRSNMLTPDIYSHRILPGDQDLDEILSTLFPSESPEDMGQMTFSGEITQMSFFNKVTDLGTYNVFLRHGLTWANAYHFHDSSVFCDSSRWRTFINHVYMGGVNVNVYPGDCGWLLRRQCVKWIESEDQDKREVIEMMDEDQLKRLS